MTQIRDAAGAMTPITDAKSALEAANMREAIARAIWIADGYDLTTERWRNRLPHADAVLSVLGTDVKLVPVQDHEDWRDWAIANGFVGRYSDITSSIIRALMILGVVEHRDKPAAISTQVDEAAVGREWQPIETAPKDRAVLLFRPDEPYPEMVVGEWVEFAPPGKKWVESETGSDLRHQPTHWMPLPEGPDASRPAPVGGDG